MKEETYLRHLKYLQKIYPSARYYCHPRELTNLPESVFGKDMTQRPDRPLECHFAEVGFPSRLVGVCSTSLVTLPCLVSEDMDVDIITLSLSEFDGPKGDLLQLVDSPTGTKLKLNISRMQDYLLCQLKGRTKSVRTIQQPQI